MWRDVWAMVSLAVSAAMMISGRFSAPPAIEASNGAGAIDAQDFASTQAALQGDTPGANSDGWLLL